MPLAGCGDPDDGRIGKFGREKTSLLIICWQMPGGCRFAVCPCQKIASFNVSRTEKIHKDCNWKRQK